MQLPAKKERELLIPTDPASMVEWLAQLQEVRVLLVEDDTDQADAIIRQLDESHQVDVARTYAEGMAAIRRAEHDVYLIDYYLDGDRTGTELIVEGSALGVRPMVLITAFGSDAIGDEALARGASDYLSKHHISSGLLQRTVRNNIARTLRVNALLRERAELAEAALTDSLTGLANRAALDEASAAALGSEFEEAVLYLDMDGFKSINDQHGHAAGDDLLRQTAMRLVQSLRPTDMVSRIGGDEFVVLLRHIRPNEISLRQCTEKVARKLLSVMRSPFLVHDSEGRPITVHLSCSIGIGLPGGDEHSAQSLTKLADRAMYQAKSAGRDTYRVKAG